MSVRRIWVLVAAFTLVGLAGCTDDTTPREPAEVNLTLDREVDGPIRIGVIGSLTSPQGEGEDHAAAMAGAWVAAYRFAKSGHEVEIIFKDDRGSAVLAEQAVSELDSDGVSGIVVATQGSHLDGALQAASDAGIAVLVPYGRPDAALPSGVWSTGGTRQQLDGALQTAMANADVSSAAVISEKDATPVAAGGAPLVLDGTNLDQIVTDLAAADAEATVDAVVVSASAATQVQVLAQLQGRVPAMPVFLTPEATTTAFAVELGRSTATSSGAFTSIGVEAFDPLTLEAGPRGDAAAAFFAAQRLAFADPSWGDPDLGTFAEFGEFADIASHDAVVALVRAIEDAGSVDASDVLDALDGSTVTRADGIAGPRLDFADSEAVDDESLVVLHPTTQEPGVRARAADSDVALVHWFATPGDD